MKRRLSTIGRLLLMFFWGAAATMADTNYTFTTLAGMAGGMGNTDGMGSMARFNLAAGLVADTAGNLYIADTYNHTIRKMTPAGVVTTFAGHCCYTGSTDGPAATAKFDFPIGVALDNTGNLYVADSVNHTIRKVTPTGMVSTLAGLAGRAGYADGVGTNAQFNDPRSVAVDATGNVYVAEEGNDDIRMITPDGTVTTFAGSAGNPGSADGTGTDAQFSNPRGVAVDTAGNVFVADWGNHTVRKITTDGTVTTLAGLAGKSGSKDGTNSVARFYNPRGVATDAAGNVYVADYNNDLIRQVTPDGVVTTLAGLAGNPGSANGTNSAARFNLPESVTVDTAGNVYVSDAFNYLIRTVTLSGTNWVVTTVAGSPRNAGSTDGMGGAARFFDVMFLALDSLGNVYAADYNNHEIRKMTPGGVVTTVAGLARSSGTADGTNRVARFNHPEGVAVDSAGNVYVGDNDNHTIRKITPSGTNWITTTLAGTAGTAGRADGTGTTAQFNNPRGLVFDSGGNLYVADCYNHTIRKITPAGVVSTFAGTPGGTGTNDGQGTSARFRYPDAVAVDRADNLYVTDHNNHTIRKVTPSGAVTTLAGLATVSGGADGQGSAARFWYPTGIAADSGGNLFVTDNQNGTIRHITPDGTVTTIGGLAEQLMHVDGPGNLARFSGPFGIACDPTGLLYISDSPNNVISVASQSGVWTPPATVRVVSTNVASGASVDMCIQLLANGNENALEFSLNYDPAVLICTNVALDTGASGATLGADLNQAASGQVGVALILPTDASFPTGVVSVLKVSFLTRAVTNNTPAVITFGDQPMVRQISDPIANELPGIFVGGTVTVAATGPAEYEGDVAPRPGGNHSVTVTDWVLMGRYVARLDYPTNAGEFQRADCAPRATFGDGKIGVGDWVQAGRYVSGKDPLTLVGGPTNEAGSLASQANGVGIAPLGLRKPLGQSLSCQLLLRGAALLSGQTAIVRASLVAAGGEQALSFSLSFDPATCTYGGASLGSGAVGAVLNANTNQAAQGRLGFALAYQGDGCFAAGTNEVLQVNFLSATSDAGNSTVSFGDQPVPRDLADTNAASVTASYQSATLVLLPTLPKLKLTPTGPDQVLAWPDWGTNFLLQSASALGRNINWSNTVVTPCPSNGECVIRVPGAGASNAFYRLLLPPQ